jgi:apolipoprotein N-acyltransferase
MPLADRLIVCVVVFASELLILKPSLRHVGVAFGAVAALTFLPMLLPISAQAEDGTMKIASAQGNANAGLFSNRESGRIYKNHIQATERLLESKEPFDVLVWPENAVDLDVFGNSNNYRELETLVDRINRPLIFGTVTQRDKLYNTSVLWLPKKTMTDWYDKTKPVPFAEYVPDRAFWSKVSPDLVGLLSYDFSPGSRDGIFKVNGKKLGTLICFEIAVDDVPRNLVDGGAEVILSQTNNSDFGKSDEAFQQLAIAKLRAIETGRSLVNISTVGPSAVYLADGTEVAALPAFTRGFMNTKVPLRTSKTPAMFVVGPLTWITVLASIGLGLWLLGSNIFTRRRK